MIRTRRPALLAATLATAALTLALGVTPSVAAPVVAQAGQAGAAWTQQPAAAGRANYQNNLLAVTAPEPGRVFAAGYALASLPGALEWRSLVQYWDGSTWTVMNTPSVETAPSRTRLFGIDGTSVSDVWAVGNAGVSVGSSQSQPFAIHYDGATWRSVGVPEPVGVQGSYLLDVVSVSPTNVWAVGTSGTFPAQPFVARWNGTSWTSRIVTRPRWCAPGAPAELTAVDAGQGGEVFAGGHCETSAGRVGFVLQRVDNQWREVARSMPAVTGIPDLTVTSSGDVWAVGSQLLPAKQASRGFALVRRAGVWTRVVRPVVTGRSEDIFGVAEGPGGIVFSGTNFTPLGVTPAVVTATSPGWLTHPVSPVPTANSYLRDVASDGTTLWAVGWSLPGTASQPYILRS